MIETNIGIILGILLLIIFIATLIFVLIDIIIFGIKSIKFLTKKQKRSDKNDD